MSGSRSSAASVTMTTVESVSRAARADASAKASVRSPGSWEGPIRSMASRAAAWSSVSLTRTSALSDAATSYPLDELPALLRSLQAIDRAVRASRGDA